MVVATLFLVGSLVVEDADAKRKKRRLVQPPLRILSIALTPDPYVAGDGVLDLTVEVTIPEGTESTTILEVSSLIASPSKRHVRFLSTRKPVADLVDHPDAEHEPVESEEGADGGADPAFATDKAQPVFVTLSWDGTDQARETIPPGRYDYVIRAKLLAATEDGPRTRMLSWKKKGDFSVHPPEPEPPDEVDNQPQPDGE